MVLKSPRAKTHARNRLISGLKRIVADLQALAKSSTAPPHQHQTNAQTAALSKNISDSEKGASHSDEPPHKKSKPSPRENIPTNTAINYISSHRDLEQSGVPSPPPTQILATNTKPSSGSVNAFVQHSPLYSLPNELLLAIGTELLLEDITSLLSVCRLFRDLFFPVYLAGHGFRTHQGYLRIASRERFMAFRSFHWLSKIGRTCYLSIAFSEDVEFEASCIKYSLSQIPKGTFDSVRFTCDPRGVSVNTLAALLTAFTQGGCRFLNIERCLVQDGLRQVAGNAEPIWPLERLVLDVDLHQPLFRSLIVATSTTLRELTLTSAFRANTNDTHSSQCKSLLTTLQFPQLTLIKLDEDIPLVTLIEFLSRHPTVSIVAIAALAEPQRLEDTSFDPINLFELESLTEISGPPSYVQRILRCASTPLSLSRLSMIPGLSTPSFFSGVSRCMTLCHRIRSLHTTMPAYTPEISFSPGEGFGLFLDIEVLRIRMMEDFESFLTFPDSEIIEGWNKLYTHLPNVTDLQLFETLYCKNRRDLFEALVLQFPALAISVSSGANLFQNEVAVKSRSNIIRLSYE